MLEIDDEARKHKRLSGVIACVSCHLFEDTFGALYECALTGHQDLGASPFWHDADLVRGALDGAIRVATELTAQSSVLTFGWGTGVSMIGAERKNPADLAEAAAESAVELPEPLIARLTEKPLLSATTSEHGREYVLARSACGRAEEALVRTHVASAERYHARS